MSRINRVGGCVGSRVRTVGYNCGEFPPYPEVVGNWPVCADTGYRGGNWMLAACAAFGAYSPDTIFIGGASPNNVGGLELHYAGPCEWQSVLRTRDVSLDGVSIGTYEYYFSLVFSGVGVGGAVLTAHTVAHPDPRFPLAVVWTNRLPLADSTIMTLVDSTTYSDAMELVPFLVASHDSLESFTSDIHGQPWFEPDGLVPTAPPYDDRRDPFFEAAIGGEVFCAWKITGTQSAVTLCGSITIEGIALYCSSLPFASEPVLMTAKIENFSYPGTAHDGFTIGDATCVKVIGDGPNCNGTRAYIVTKHPAVDYNQVSRVELEWQADCTGVTLAARVYMYANYGDVNYVTDWVWNNLPFDWWKSTLTQSETLTSGLPGFEISHEHKITLNLNACGAYYYYGGGGGRPPCLKQNVYVFVDDGPVHAIAFNPLFPAPYQHWGTLHTTPPTRDCDITFRLGRTGNVDPSSGAVEWELRIAIIDAPAPPVSYTRILWSTCDTDGNLVLSFSEPLAFYGAVLQVELFTSP